MTLYLLQSLKEAMKDFFAEKNHTHNNLKNTGVTLESLRYIVSNTNELIDALNSIKTSETIILKSGTYDLSQTYDLPACNILGLNNVTINGYGLNFNGDGPLTCVSNINFDGNGLTMPNGGFIHLNNDSDSHITNCSFTNAKAVYNPNGIVISKTSPNYTTTIDNCIFTGDSHRTAYNVGSTPASILCDSTEAIYNVNIYNNIFNHPMNDDSFADKARGVSFGRIVYNEPSSSREPEINNCKLYCNRYLDAGDYNYRAVEENCPDWIQTELVFKDTNTYRIANTEDNLIISFVVKNKETGSGIGSSAYLNSDGHLGFSAYIDNHGFSDFLRNTTDFVDSETIAEVETPLSNLSLGTHTITIQYPGNDNQKILPCWGRHEIEIYVPKTETSINYIVAPTIADGGEDITIKAKLIDNNNNAISGQTLTLNREQQSALTATTNNEGIATFTIANASAGQYGYYVSYAGNDTYLNCNGSQKILTVTQPTYINYISAPTTASRGSSYIISTKVTDTNNNPISDIYVDLERSGYSLYRIKTDENGIASYTGTASNTFTYSMFVEGNNTYASSGTEEKTLTVT